jgi:hypothetical protein
MFLLHTMTVLLLCTVQMLLLVEILLQPHTLDLDLQFLHNL